MNWSKRSKWLIGGAGVVALSLALVAGGAFALRGSHAACQGEAVGRAHEGHGFGRAHARAHRAHARAPHGFARGVHPAHFDFDFDELPEGARKWMAPRGRIGVHLQWMTEDLRAYFKAPKEQGVLVSTVREDSPAEKAGVRAGDVILEAAGDEVRSPRDVIRAVADVKEGKALPLTLLRDGRKQKISVTPARMERGEHGARRMGKKMRKHWKRIDQRLRAIEEKLGLPTPDADSKAP